MGKDALANAMRFLDVILVKAEQGFQTVVDVSNMVKWMSNE